VDKTTIGYGLIVLLFGVFFLVERNSFARDGARQQRRLQRWLGINLGGQREVEQKRGIVAVGVVCIIVGVVVILIGIFQ
jgi:vacuolar-type H+-ATPase subunit I/STV1